MSKYIIDGVQMTSLADAVRSATGTSEPLSFGEIVSTVGTMGTGTDYLASTCNKTITNLNNSEIERVPMYMFQSCNQLSQVNLPNCKLVSQAGFQRCSSLQTVSLENCSLISDYAFYECQSLRDVYIPSCTSISQQAFINCDISNFYAPNLAFFSQSALPTDLNVNYIVSEYCNTPHMFGSFINPVFRSYSGTFNSKIMIVGTENTLMTSDVNPWYDSETFHLNFPSEVGYITGSAFYSNTTGAFDYIKGISGSGITTISLVILSNYLRSINYLNCPSLTDVQFQTNHPTMSTFVVGNLLICGNNGLRYAQSTSGIPSDLTRCKYFGSYAMYNKSNFTLSINLAECTYIGDSAFYNCSNVEFYGKLNKCTTISSNAFLGCSKLYSIEAPQLNTVYSNVFQGCENLSYVICDVLSTIGSSMCRNDYALELASFKECSMINQSAFFSCSSLQTFYAPKCRTIYSNVFWGCSSLSDLTLNWDNLILNGSNVFNGCNLILSTHEDNCEYISVNGNSTYFLNSVKANKDTATIDCYLMEIVAFLNYYVSNLTLPNVRYLPSNMWSNKYTYLKTIRADNCKSIYTSALANCSRLTEAHFSNCESIFANAIYSCYNLTILDIPKAKYIGQSAFMQCSKLTQVDIPECTSIHTSAFAYCYSISQINMPNVSYIADYAFLQCNTLSSIVVNNCKIIGNFAFENCSNLSYVEAMNLSMTSMGMFRTCKNLETAKISINYEYNYYSGKLEVALVSQIFANCNKLSSLTIDFASYNACGGIYNEAFTKCDSLQKFSMNFLFSTTSSNNNFAIGSSAFISCSILSKVLFSDMRNSIGTNVNYRPKMSASAFYNCLSLTSVYLLTNLSQNISAIWSIANSNVFTGTPMVDDTLTGSFGSIYVQSSYLSLYQADVNWSWFTDRLVGLTDQEIENVIANW